MCAHRSLGGLAAYHQIGSQHEQHDAGHVRQCEIAYRLI